MTLEPDGARDSWRESARAVNVALVRRAAVTLALAALVIVVGAAIAGGVHGAVGAVIGVAIVALFFGLDVLVFTRAGAGPRTALAVVVLYVAKLIGFGFLILAVQALVDFNHRSFVLAVIIETAVAAVAAVVVFTRMQVQYVEP